ncbi:MAG TPA: hypothetical protein VGZ47_02625 [Gemmataceae bacterium]|nr:hypothetical protein [Gemmataceae bacterium]
MILVSPVIVSRLAASPAYNTPSRGNGNSVMHHEDRFAIGGAGNWGIGEKDRLGAVCVFDIREGKVLHKYSTGTLVTAICAMPDKKRIVTGEWDGTVKVWEYVK